MKSLPKLTWFSGDQHTFRFTVADLSVDKRGKTPADLSGLTAKWSLSVRGKKGYFKPAVLTVDAVVLNQVTNKGQVEVTVTSADTALLLGQYHQQLELYDALAGSEVVADGDMEFSLNIEEV